MGLACSFLFGLPLQAEEKKICLSPNFVPLPNFNLAAGTVTIRNFRNLTHYDGIGTFGAVARNPSTLAARWQLYR